MSKKKVKFTKIDIGHRVKLNEVETTTDAEIFGMVRQFQDMHEQQNIEVENLAEVYKWMKEFRDELSGKSERKNKIRKTKRS